MKAQDPETPSQNMDSQFPTKIKNKAIVRNSEISSLRYETLVSYKEQKTNTTTDAYVNSWFPIKKEQMTIMNSWDSRPG